MAAWEGVSTSKAPTNPPQLLSLLALCPGHTHSSLLGHATHPTAKAKAALGTLGLLVDTAHRPEPVLTEAVQPHQSPRSPEEDVASS